MAQFHYLLDISGEIGISDLLSDPGGGSSQSGVSGRKVLLWSAEPEGNLNFGFTSDTLWLKSRLENPFNRVQQYYLELAFPIMDQVDVYIQDSFGRVSLRRNGDYLPAGRRDVKHRNFVVHFNLRAREKVIVYLKIKSDTSLNIRPLLWTPEMFTENSNLEMYALGIFYGVLGSMALYNIFLFLSIKDISYLYYSLYILGSIITQLIFNGIAHVHLWPEYYGWNGVSLPLSIGISNLCALFFASSFLNIFRDMPGIGRIFKVWACFSLMLILAAFLAPMSFALKFANFVIFTTVLLMSVAAIYSIRRGYQPAKYFLIAWTLLLVGILFTFFRSLGYLPSNIITLYTFQIGSLLEVFLLSIALGDRINILKFEREIARNEVLRNMIQVDKIKDEFLSNISHELNTPLASLLMNSTMLKEAFYEEGDIQDAYKLIYNDVNQLMGLVRNLLMASQIESNELKIHLKKFEVKEVFKKLSEELDERFPDYNFNLATRTQREVYLGDLEQIFNILYQLVKNALIHGGKGKGQGEKERINIEVDFRLTGDFLMIQVLDDGAGAPNDSLPRLCEKFYRVDSSLTYTQSGTGLGLYLCDKITRLLGGGLELSNRQTGGFVALCRLPCKKV